MKIVLLAMLVLVLTNPMHAQKKSSKEKIPGELMPNIPLGIVLDSDGNSKNSYQGKHHFNDFKGKLIILDFWASYCAPCVAGFTHMAELQARFKDSIQIFLVNPWESEVKIKSWIRYHDSIAPGKKLVPGSLPILAGAKGVEALFPIHGEIGYHVWISSQGKVILRGISENTNEEKIGQVLAGKTVDYVKDNFRGYDEKQMLLQSSRRAPGAVKYSSTFGSFEPNFSAYGSGVEAYVDSSAGTVRQTLINISVWDLYNRAIVYQPIQQGIVYGAPFVIDGIERGVIVQEEGVLGRRATDRDILNKISYEQVTPLNVSDSLRKRLMLRDLNGYFAEVLRIRGEWKEVEVPCFKLLFHGAMATIKSDVDNPQVSNRIINGIFSYVYKGYSSTSLLADYLPRLHSCHRFLLNDLIVDETSIDYKISLTLPDPCKFENLEQLSAVLAKLGFELKKGYTKKKLFVISPIE